MLVDDELLRRELAEELARAFYCQHDAVSVVIRTGIPTSIIPAFINPLSFWTHILELASNGALADGIQRIVDVAASVLPENKLFSQLCRPSPAAPQSNHSAAPHPSTHTIVLEEDRKDPNIASAQARLLSKLTDSIDDILRAGREVTIETDSDGKMKISIRIGSRDNPN